MNTQIYSEHLVEKGEQVLDLCALGIENGSAPRGVLDGCLFVQ